MMLHLAPHRDEVVIVFAGNVSRLSWSMPRARGGEVGQIDNLAVRWDSNHDIWPIGKACPHVDGINIAANHIGATIENGVKRSGGPQRMIVGHMVDRAILPAQDVLAAFVL